MRATLSFEQTARILRHVATQAEANLMKKLFDHQISGVAFLKEKKRAILADEMGLGKTKQAIHAAVEQPVLIVCPASLRLNWKREIEDVYPDHNVVVLRTKSDGEEKARWYIVNYDILYKWVEWAKNMNFPTTILDEAHYIKSKSKRSEQALELVKDIPNVYLLTGTPILNRPIEMFNMLKAIKHPLGKLRTTFARRTDENARQRHPEWTKLLRRSEAEFPL